MQRRHYLLACSVFAMASAGNAAETVAYGYDSLGRLTKVSRSGTVNSGVTANYSYDAADNRTNVTVAAPGTPAPPPPTPPPPPPPPPPSTSRRSRLRTASRSANARRRR